MVTAFGRKEAVGVHTMFVGMMMTCEAIKVRAVHIIFSSDHFLNNHDNPSGKE